MKLVTTIDAMAWDRFVLSRPDAVPGHLYGWRQVIETAYGHRPLYLAAADRNGEIQAVLPLFRIKRPFLPAQWVSIPFFDQAGILARNPTAGKWLIDQAACVIQSKGAVSLTIRQARRFEGQDMHVAGQNPVCYTHKVGMKIPLARNRQAMMAGFRSKLRSQVNKGLKNGLTWQIGKTRLIDPFYQVFSTNMRDLGSPVHSRAFFKAVFRHFFSRAFICVVYYKSAPCAVGVMFRFANSLSNPWASSLRSFRRLNTNMVLYWQMIGFACNLGLDFFDMGRSSAGASTHRFKQQWGPVETPLAWYSWPFNGADPVAENLCIAPWKRLPLWGANLAGPQFRKYISL